MSDTITVRCVSVSTKKTTPIGFEAKRKVVNKVTFETEEAFPPALEEGETYLIDVQITGDIDERHSD